MSQIARLTTAEFGRQRDTLNLIASENYPSPAVIDLLGSIWNTKYAEGYPGKRYYAGNTNTDELEALVQAKALAVFGATADYGVNLQVLSGSVANALVYLTALKGGDTVMSLELSSGGHLSHLHATSSWLKFFKHVTYRVRPTANGFELDDDDFRRKLQLHRPNLVIIGFSSYPRAYEFGPWVQAAHEAGALVLADIAHISGLVAAGRHDSPFRAGADFVATTTHKTLRGPRGAMVFARHQHMNQLNKTVFPGTLGGPHLNQIAATGQALAEVQGEAAYPGPSQPFADYIDHVLATTGALEAGLAATGLEIVAPTQTHLLLVRLPLESDSLEVQRHLESVGIITNRNALPYDTKPPWRPSGLRLGTAALASRGLTIAQARQLGEVIGSVILGRVSDAAATRAVANIVANLSWHYRSPA